MCRLLFMILCGSKLEKMYKKNVCIKGKEYDEFNR